MLFLSAPAHTGRAGQGVGRGIVVLPRGQAVGAR